MPFYIAHGNDPNTIPKEDCPIVLANWDYIAKLFSVFKNPPSPDAFRRYYGFDSLIIDELSAFKNISSRRFKMMRGVMNSFDYRWGLTGSPAANSMLNLFGEMLIIDSGACLGKYLTHFRNQYFNPSGYRGYQWVIKGPEAEREIFERIKPVCLRMAAEDYLELPPVVVNDIKVTLPPEAMKQYKSMHKELVAVVGDDTITAPTKAAALNKCRQMAGGGVYFSGRPTFDDVITDSTCISYFHDCKLLAIQDLVDELQGEPLLIGLGFRFEYQMLKKHFPNLPVIYGGVSPAEATGLINAWNAGKLPMLAAHPGSLAHGVNLQTGGRHVCWYTLPWDFEQYDQFNRRLYRQGQAKPVMIHRLIAEKTIDEYVKVLLLRKCATQNDLFNYLKEELLQ